MEETGIILSAVGIRRQFETVDGILQVLKDVTFSVHHKEMMAVTGASGVGKSTLLHILGGLDRPTDGKVTIRGQSLNGKSEHWLAGFRNARVGFVFQHHFLLDDFTALENVKIPLLVGGASHRQAARQAEQLLAQVGLTGRKNHLPRQLSGGEQQRVAVARALANQPEVVLADEPSGNLDTKTGRALHDLLWDLNRDHHTTFVIATHNRELAGRCHRQMEIVDGRITDMKSTYGS